MMKLGGGDLSVGVYMKIMLTCVNVTDLLTQ